jgi:hypothetical protein
MLVYSKSSSCFMNIQIVLPTFFMHRDTLVVSSIARLDRYYFLEFLETGRSFGVSCFTCIDKMYLAIDSSSDTHNLSTGPTATAKVDDRLRLAGLAAFFGVEAFAFLGLAAFAGFFAIFASAFGFAAAFFVAFAALAMVLSNGSVLVQKDSFFENNFKIRPLPAQCTGSAKDSDFFPRHFCTLHGQRRHFTAISCSKSFVTPLKQITCQNLFFKTRRSPY